MKYSLKNKTTGQDADTVQPLQSLKGLLRFTIFGSTGSEQSSFLEQLLNDSRVTFKNQTSGTETESNNGEHNLTSGCAIHYFETNKRQFITADTVEHQQYCNNMVTTASMSDTAVILVNASRGVDNQTRRHSYMMSLFGIKQIILVVNKMDLVDYAQNHFDNIVAEYNEFADQLDFEVINFVPVYLLTGDNLLTTQDTSSSSITLKGNMPWYLGATLIELLETIPSHPIEKDQGFRLPVQSVNRLNPDFFSFSGNIASGNISHGMTVVSSLSGRSTQVKKIIGPSGEVISATSGQAVTLIMENDIEIGAGDIIALEDNQTEVSDQFAAHIIWMNSEAMLPERTYVIRFISTSTTAQITDLVHKIDVNTLVKLAAKKLELNEVGYCKLALDKAVAFDAFSDNQQTGAFVLIDPYSQATVGAGIIDFALRRASNIGWHNMKIDKAIRAAVNHQKPCVVWFTGFSGSGKSHIADHLEQKLHARGKRTYLLDGDNIRFGLNKDLGFTDQDRVENIRRVAEVAKLMVDAGLIVLASFISPFRSERRMARELFNDDEFVEVHVDTPLAICEQRDPKDLYKKARAGELKNFTGIDSDYEPPEQAEMVLKSGEFGADTLADELVEYLVSKGIA